MLNHYSDRVAFSFVGAFEFSFV